jgi:hypothetical protein
VNAKEALIYSSCRRRPASSALKTMDDSLRSPFGPPLRAFNAQALLSGMRRDDDKGINQSFTKGATQT